MSMQTKIALSLQKQFDFLSEIHHCEFNQNSTFIATYETLIGHFDYPVSKIIENQILNAANLLLTKTNDEPNSPDSYKIQLKKLDRIKNQLNSTRDLINELIVFHAINETSKDELFTPLAMINKIITTNIIEDDCIGKIKNDYDIHSFEVKNRNRPQKSKNEKLAFYLINSCLELILDYIKKNKISHGLNSNLFSSISKSKTRKISKVLLTMIFLNFLNIERTEKTVSNSLKISETELMNSFKIKSESEFTELITNYLFNNPTELREMHNELINTLIETKQKKLLNTKIARYK